MRRIEFRIERSVLMGTRSSVIVIQSDGPRRSLIDGIIQDIATDVEVTAGGVTLHLAAWMDPDHWADDWEAEGVEDPEAFIEALVA